MFYNNYKRSITFKNCESLCCILLTYIILYTNYILIKNKMSLLEHLSPAVCICDGEGGVVGSSKDHHKVHGFQTNPCPNAGCAP